MRLITLFTLATMAAVPAAAQDKMKEGDAGSRAGTGTSQKGEITKTTQKFVKEAASGNTLEVETSRLALQKSQNSDVKGFAQMMIDDHTKVGEDMKAALKEAGLPPPADKLTPKHQETVDKLNKADAGKFDAQYVDAQIKAHEEAIALFSQYAKNGDTQQLKQFAEAKLPSLEKHQTMARDLQSKMGAGTGTSQ